MGSFRKGHRSITPLPGPRIAAFVPWPVDEPRRGPGIGVRLRRILHALRHPGLGILRDVAQELDLHLVRRMEAVRRAVGLVEGAERIRADAVEIEVVAGVLRRAVARGSAPVAAARAVVPVVLVQPAVPPLVLEVAGPRAGVGVRRARVVEKAVGRDLVRAEEMRVEAAEAAAVVAAGVIEARVEVASGGFAQGPVIDRAVPRAAVQVRTSAPPDP